MPSYTLLYLLLGGTWLIFTFCLGAIVGSFLNVVAYRVPLGRSLISPPSSCPHCGTRLRFLRENLPILGWILLRGRCRFCRAPISIQYPLIELITAILFCIPYILWFMPADCYSLLGIDPAALRPEWITRSNITAIWPMLPLTWVLTGCLIAATLVDARTFFIPMWFCWIMGLAGAIGHTAHAITIQLTRRTIGHPRLPAESFPLWTIPTFSGPWLAAIIGASIGLLLAVILLLLRVIPRSYADFEAWERSIHPNPNDCPLDCDILHPAPPTPCAPPALPDEPIAQPRSLQVRRAIYLTAPAIALMFAGFALGLRATPQRPILFMLAGMAIGLLLGLLLRRAATDPASSESQDPHWLQYPHTRREMLKEILFLLPPTLGGLAAWKLAAASPALSTWLADPPLWISALGASLAGYLAGGAVVWIIRILGSLAFGRDAMGLGDVHLMAGVGAIIGWAIPILVFFVAPFIAIAFVILSTVASSIMKREGAALPYGPHLAAATLIVLFAHPLFEHALAAILGFHPRLL